MACLKCGKKTKEEQVFCPDCLESMDAYPVKRDIHIQLPNRPIETAQKRSNRKRRNLLPEEQVVYLRIRNRRYKFIIFLLTLALVAALVGLFFLANVPEELKKYGIDYTFIA